MIQNEAADMKSKIRNSALIEFSEQGYDMASTNQIIKRAGISKGILFYHFPSKRALFDDLVEYASSFITNRYINRLDSDEPDFIKKCYHAARVKMAAMQENPHAFTFLANIYLNDLNALTAEQQKTMEDAAAKGYATLYQNLDMSLFRQDLSSERTIKMIQWSIDGYTNELIQRFKGKDLNTIDFDPYWEDFDAFLNDLRKVFYHQTNK